MNFKFYGAASCVTGSCHLINIRGKNVLLDCGLYQGRDEKERGNDEFDFDPQNIDYVILSHSHIDHCGRIPLLYKKGFKGQVLCTKATKALCSVMLPDSGHIQEMEVEWKNRKRLRQGLDLLEPLYTAKVAQLSMNLFTGYNYDETINLFEGFSFSFRDAGHLLGSAIIEMHLKEDDGKEAKVVYTGDLGNINIPIIKDPTPLYETDYLIMETTYGDRVHEKVSSQLKELVKIIKDTFARGGNVIIPSFAVGRTQELLYDISKHIASEELKGLTVYVDSPLAYEATEIFNKFSDYFDEEAKKTLSEGNNFLNFKGLQFAKSPEDSARINKIQKGALVISASGMCDAGRIKHHLKHNLWRKECSIVFVGYQAEGTLGRSILDGAKKVKIFGEEIAVNAKIYNLQGLSGHADREGLLNWVKKFNSKPKDILLVHGDKEAGESFNNLLKDEGYTSKIMNYGDIYDIDKGNTIKIQNKKDRIFSLLNSLNDIDSMDEEALLKDIRNAIKNS